VQKIIGQLDSLRHVVYLPYLNRDGPAAAVAHTLLWDELLQHPAVPAVRIQVRAGAVRASAVDIVLFG